jgi:hypothetical protein
MKQALPDMPLTFPPVAPAMLGEELGDERAARIASRHRFVAAKRSFLDAASLTEGVSGAQLRRRIRLAPEPSHLLALQEELLEALPQDSVQVGHYLRALYRELDALFPDSALTGFVPL